MAYQPPSLLEQDRITDRNLLRIIADYERRLSSLERLLKPNLLALPFINVWDRADFTAGADCAGTLNQIMEEASFELGESLVYMPPFEYGVLSELVVPRRVRLWGGNSTIAQPGTVIKALSGFSGTRVLSMVDPDGSSFGTQVEHLCVDAAGLVNTAVYANGFEENSGFRNVRVREFTQYGFLFENGGAASGLNARNFFLEELYATVSAAVVSGDEIGVYLKGANDASGYNFMRGIKGITVDITPSGGVSGLAGIRLIDCRATLLEMVHVEGCDYGIDFQEDCQGCVAVGVGGNGETALVHIGTPGNDGIVLQGIWPKGAGATIIDDKYSITIAQPEIVPLYVCGGAMHLYSGGRTQSWNDWYQNNVAANQTAVMIPRRSDSSGVPIAHTDQLVMGADGSAMRIWVRSNAARTNGTLTLQLYKNSAAVTGATVVIDGTNTQFNFKRFARGVNPFVGGDRLDLRITTDASWAPTTADITAGIEVETAY